MLSVTEIERRSPSGAQSARQVQASLRLEFERDGRAGATVLASSEQEPPLKVVRAFTLDDGAALAHLHNLSGGLLGGDQLSLSVRVGAGASAQLTTTGATRLYRTRAGAPAAAQRTEIVLAENALLEYLPDPVIPYAGARFCQTTRIELAAGAGLFWWEVVTPGREARGELFQYERLEMKTDVVAAGRCIAAERLRLAPQEFDAASPARLGGFRHWATFYICRASGSPAEWTAAENALREIGGELSGTGETLWAISTLLAHGILIRGLARHGRNALIGLRKLWGAAKQMLYGREAIPPRKVY